MRRSPGSSSPSCGAESVLLLDAATFGLSALLVAAGVRGIRAAEPRKAETPVSVRAYGTELREGYAHLFSNRLLLSVVVMVMFMNGLDQGWYAVLLPVHAEAELGGATDIGLLTALFGAGGLTGALLYGAVGHRFPRRAVFTACVILCGAPRYLVAAVTGTTLPLAVTMLLGGIAGGVLNPILTTVIYERVPDRLRSRVSGALTAGCEFAMPLGGLAAGLLVEGAGATGALVAMGGIYFLATLSPLVFPSWRTLDDQVVEESGPVPGTPEAEEAKESGKPGKPRKPGDSSVPPQVSSSAPSHPSPGP